MIRIIDLSYIRIGNEKYAEENKSFGLSTLQRKHVEVVGATVTMRFPAKSGKAWDVTITDKGVARVVKHLKAQRTKRLFTVDGRRIRSGDVNELLLRLTGEHLTAKNFRTWGGTLAAFAYLRGQARQHSPGREDRGRSGRRGGRRSGQHPHRRPRPLRPPTRAADLHRTHFRRLPRPCPGGPAPVGRGAEPRTSGCWPRCSPSCSRPSSSCSSARLVRPPATRAPGAQRSRNRRVGVNRRRNG